MIDSKQMNHPTATRIQIERDGAESDTLMARALESLQATFGPTVRMTRTTMEVSSLPRCVVTTIGYTATMWKNGRILAQGNGPGPNSAAGRLIEAMNAIEQAKPGVIRRAANWLGDVWMCLKFWNHFSA